MVVGIDLRSGITLFKIAVDAIGQRQSTVKILLREIDRPLDILQPLGGVGDRHRGELWIQKAGGRMVVTVADQNKSWQVFADPAHVLQGPRAKRWMADAVDHLIGGAHEVDALLVSASRCGERPHHGQAIGERGKFF